MAKKRRKGAHTAQQKKFQRVARDCHKQLRAGDLPSKGQFKTCMRKGLNKKR